VIACNCPVTLAALARTLNPPRDPNRPRSTIFSRVSTPHFYLSGEAPITTAGTRTRGTLGDLDLEDGEPALERKEGEKEGTALGLRLIQSLPQDGGGSEEEGASGSGSKEALEVDDPALPSPAVVSRKVSR
jgi:hypothetical protein